MVVADDAVDVCIAAALVVPFELLAPVATFVVVVVDSSLSSLSLSLSPNDSRINRCVSASVSIS